MCDRERAKNRSIQEMVRNLALQNFVAKALKAEDSLEDDIPFFRQAEHILNIKSSPIHLAGEIPNPADLPSGCPFHTRCPRFLGEICATTTPPWQVDQKTGKRIFCHIPLEELVANQIQIDISSAAKP